MALLPIVLQKSFNPKVTVGKVVACGDLLASKNTGKEEIIPLAKVLGVSPTKVLSCLKKGLGDRIGEGELLAEKKKLVGGKKFFSPLSGTIVRLEESTGNLYILTQSEEDVEVLKSPVDGKVTFCDNIKIVLETEKEIVSAEKASGNGIRGELIGLSGEVIKQEDVSGDLTKKIILGLSFEKAAFSKAFALGALGIIGVNIEDEEIDNFIEKEIKNPIFKVSLDSFKQLVAAKTKQIYLDTENKTIIIL